MKQRLFPQLDPEDRTCIAAEWRDDLHDADTAEPLQRLGRRVCIALLRRIERVPAIFSVVDGHFDLPERFAFVLPLERWGHRRNLLPVGMNVTFGEHYQAIGALHKC